MGLVSGACAAFVATLDETTWALERDAGDVAVYLSPTLTGRLRLKVVSHHVAPKARIVATLRDLLRTQRQTNPDFLEGRLLDAWPDALDPYGDLVCVTTRTGVLPPRDHVFGVHTVSVSAGTTVVLYTPRDGTLQASGQRVTQLENGLVRVEHLVDSSETGAWHQWGSERAVLPKRIHDLVKRARAIRNLATPRLCELDVKQMLRVAHRQLTSSADFDLIHSGHSARVSRGLLRTCPREVLRVSRTVPTSLKITAQNVGLDLLTCLPHLRERFGAADVLRRHRTSRNQIICRLRYPGRGVGGKREMAIARTRIDVPSKREILFLYQSVAEGAPEPGLAKVHNAIRYLQEVPGGTRITTLLVCDLGGERIEWRLPFAQSAA